MTRCGLRNDSAFWGGGTIIIAHVEVVRACLQSKPCVDPSVPLGLGVDFCADWIK
jgi:hypothetical protein